MQFKIIGQNFQDASYYKKDDVDFLLEEDRWNDYNYHTLYHLHATSRLTRKPGAGAEYLGPVNIMKVGQKEDEMYLLGQAVGQKAFSSLPEDFYSMITSIPLFEALHRLLPAEQRQRFIRSFRLILSDRDKYYQAVKDDKCFNTSLLRWVTMNSLSLQTGRSLLLDEQTQYNLRLEKLKVRLNGAVPDLEFDFSPLQPDELPLLPNGTIAFIGKNGSGKSTALYKIAALIYSNLNEREILGTRIGTIEPADITVSRLLMFSYSP